MVVSSERTVNALIEGSSVVCPSAISRSGVSVDSYSRSSLRSDREEGSFSDRIDPGARFDPRKGQRTERPITHVSGRIPFSPDPRVVALACIHHAIQLRRTILAFSSRSYQMLSFARQSVLKEVKPWLRGGRNDSRLQIKDP